MGKLRISTDDEAVIGDRLRTLRLRRKMSQEQLGEELGVSFQQVQKYEKGSNRIATSRLIQLASILKVPVGYFTDDVGISNKLSREDARALAFAKHPHAVRMMMAMEKMTTEQRLSLLTMAEAFV